MCKYLEPLGACKEPLFLEGAHDSCLGDRDPASSGDVQAPPSGGLFPPSSVDEVPSGASLRYLSLTTAVCLSCRHFSVRRPLVLSCGTLTGSAAKAAPVYWVDPYVQWSRLFVEALYRLYREIV